MSRHHHRARTPMIYPAAVMMRLEGSARVGWAKWYDEARKHDATKQANAVLVDRIETLLPEFLKLIDDVLRERNCQAFAHAYRVEQLIRDYYRGERSYT